MLPVGFFNLPNWTDTPKAQNHTILGHQATPVPCVRAARFNGQIYEWSSARSASPELRSQCSFGSFLFSRWSGPVGSRDSGPPPPLLLLSSAGSPPVRPHRLSRFLTQYLRTLQQPRKVNAALCDQFSLFTNWTKSVSWWNFQNKAEKLSKRAWKRWILTRNVQFHQLLMCHPQCAHHAAVETPSSHDEIRIRANAALFRCNNWIEINLYPPICLISCRAEVQSAC